MQGQGGGVCLRLGPQANDQWRAKAVERVSALACCMSDRCRAKAVECVSALARSKSKQCRAKAVEYVSALARKNE